MLPGAPVADDRRSTTNHLERLDPALSRPGRMDVWVEFKNASKWQAEQLFRNFFPSTDEDEIVFDERELDGIELPSMPSSPAVSSARSSMLFTESSVTLSPTPSSASLPSSESTSAASASARGKARQAHVDPALRNQAYLPPPVDEEIAKHSAPPLDGKTLARLAKKFADAIPDEEFSVAALQGCESSGSFVADPSFPPCPLPVPSCVVVGGVPVSCAGLVRVGATGICADESSSG